jgi:peptidoglycan/xylan/chitin deacetylase (PgdA/CDA1 family)
MCEGDLLPRRLVYILPSRGGFSWRATPSALTVSAVAPFFRVPGLARSEIIDSELSARLLVNFSSDVEADDWHPRISPKKTITLAVSRLIARGKGILLLHDIHRATVDALPGMLKELNERGFHIVQVVPRRLLSSDISIVELTGYAGTRAMSSF